jgi:hypothetical protein
MAFLKVGAVNATENTDKSCIMSGDGLGMSASWVCGFAQTYNTTGGSCLPIIL